MWAWEAARNPTGLRPIAASFVRELPGSPLAPRYITSASGTMPAPEGLTAGASLPFKQKPSLPESLLSLALRYER